MHSFPEDDVYIVLKITQALSKGYIAQVGWMSEGYRFSRKQGSWLPSLEHRAGVDAKEIGSFTYDFSKGNLQTIALDSSIIVDHIRFQVCLSAPLLAQNMKGIITACLVDQAGELLICGHSVK